MQLKSGGGHAIRIVGTVTHCFPISQLYCPSPCLLFHQKSNDLKTKQRDSWQADQERADRHSHSLTLISVSPCKHMHTTYTHPIQKVRSSSLRLRSRFCLFCGSMWLADVCLRVYALFVWEEVCVYSTRVCRNVFVLMTLCVLWGICVFSLSTSRSDNNCWPGSSPWSSLAILAVTAAAVA